MVVVVATIVNVTAIVVSGHPGDSHNRDGSHRRACSHPRGSSRPPNRGCHLYIFGGDVASRCLWELV